MMQISKTDLKAQIYIDLDYAERIDDGVLRAQAVRLVGILASQLTQEERNQIVATHTFARTLDL